MVHFVVEWYDELYQNFAHDNHLAQHLSFSERKHLRYVLSTCLPPLTDHLFVGGRRCFISDPPHEVERFFARIDSQKSYPCHCH